MTTSPHLCTNSRTSPGCAKSGRASIELSARLAHTTKTNSRAPTSGEKGQEKENRKKGKIRFSDKQSDKRSNVQPDPRGIVHCQGPLLDLISNIPRFLPPAYAPSLPTSHSRYQIFGPIQEPASLLDSWIWSLLTSPHTRAASPFFSCTLFFSFTALALCSMHIPACLSVSAPPF